MTGRGRNGAADSIFPRNWVEVDCKGAIGVPRVGVPLTCRVITTIGMPSSACAIVSTIRLIGRRLRFCDTDSLSLRSRQSVGNPLSGLSSFVDENPSAKPRPP